MKNPEPNKPMTLLIFVSMYALQCQTPRQAKVWVLKNIVLKNSAARWYRHRAGLARELRQTVARCDRGSPANYGNLHRRHGWPGTALYVDTDKAMPRRVLAKCCSNHPAAVRTGRQNGPRYCRQTPLLALVKKTHYRVFFSAENLMTMVKTDEGRSFVNAARLFLEGRGITLELTKPNTGPVL